MREWGLGVPGVPRTQPRCVPVSSGRNLSPVIALLYDQLWAFVIHRQSLNYLVWHTKILENGLYPNFPLSLLDIHDSLATTNLCLSPAQRMSQHQLSSWTHLLHWWYHVNSSSGPSTGSHHQAPSQNLFKISIVKLIPVEWNWFPTSPDLHKPLKAGAALISLCIPIFHTGQS